MPKYKKEYSDLVKQVRDAADELETAGLLVAEDSIPRPTGKKQPGRRVEWYRKARWTEVTNSPAATEEVKRLELARDHFEL